MIFQVAVVLSECDMLYVVHDMYIYVYIYIYPFCQYSNAVIVFDFTHSNESY